ncbi:serine/arginine repetitive matrix protein 1-like [Eptesicus fuscus]|uniref:serine/arginine repetitive matrix protein 1-like n=1 Tax=Eptesicus fuscus TaxID=29078 RepID=UPI00240470D8|nr:serine/arginine repetitive matrix protein 1-like [Eptesicus fuscus]
MQGGFVHAGARRCSNGVSRPQRQPGRTRGVRKGCPSPPRARRSRSLSPSAVEKSGSPRKSANREGGLPPRRAERRRVSDARASRRGPSSAESSTLPTGRPARRASASRAPAPSRPPPRSAGRPAGSSSSSTSSSSSRRPGELTRAPAPRARPPLPAPRPDAQTEPPRLRGGRRSRAAAPRSESAGPAPAHSSLGSEAAATPSAREQRRLGRGRSARPPRGPPPRRLGSSQRLARRRRREGRCVHAGRRGERARVPAASGRRAPHRRGPHPLGTRGRGAGRGAAGTHWPHCPDSRVGVPGRRVRGARARSRPAPPARRPRSGLAPLRRPRPRPRKLPAAAVWTREGSRPPARRRFSGFLSEESRTAAFPWPSVWKTPLVIFTALTTAPPMGEIRSVNEEVPEAPKTTVLFKIRLQSCPSGFCYP